MSTHDISIPYNGEKTTVSGSSGENYVFFDGSWNSSCDLCGVLGSTVPPGRLLLPGNRRLTTRVCVAIRTLGHLIQELLHEFIAMYYLCLGFLVFADIIVVRSQGDLCLGGGDKDVVENLPCDHFQLGRWRWCARQCRSIKLDISVIVSVESISMGIAWREPSFSHSSSLHWLRLVCRGGIGCLGWRSIVLDHVGSPQEVPPTRAKVSTRDGVLRRSSQRGRKPGRKPSGQRLDHT